MIFCNFLNSGFLRNTLKKVRSCYLFLTNLNPNAKKMLHKKGSAFCKCTSILDHAFHMIKGVYSTSMMPVGGIHVMEVTEVDSPPIRRVGGV